MHVVVFEERDPPSQCMIIANPEHLMDEVSARLIGGMRFSGEDDLNRTPMIVQQVLEPLEVAEQECRAFIRSEASGKPDGQGLRIQERTAGQHL